MSKDLGARISRVLEQNNMTQKELAEKLYLTEASMSRYISGEREPRPDVLRDIASELHTSADYLLGLDPGEYIHSEIVNLLRVNAGSLTNREKREIINALFPD